MTCHPSATCTDSVYNATPVDLLLQCTCYLSVLPVPVGQNLITLLGHRDAHRPPSARRAASSVLTVVSDPDRSIGLPIRPGVVPGGSGCFSAVRPGSPMDRRVWESRWHRPHDVLLNFRWGSRTTDIGVCAIGPLNPLDCAGAGAGSSEAEVRMEKNHSQL